ncbi:Rho GTPase-activating protein 15 [Oryzias melastigma]|uniref:Rho GTPase-activating protein 15 n=1 Tax=Oryzias melastigma TaxID=30732 RepID=A0A834FAB4_ORYME|nr:Rho GTPase-activating protein 15 [Oryzias melastigma]
MAGIRAVNLESGGKKVLLIQPSNTSTELEKAVQMRTKTAHSSEVRLSQSKSMVLQEFEPPQKTMQLKNEYLNVAKLSTEGKKQKKSWSLMWTVLTADHLLFYKDKQETGLTPSGKSDTVQLCGTVIEWTNQKSRRKNVFQVTTTTGSEYLVQNDCYLTALKWYNAIRKNANSSTKEEKGQLQRSNSTEHLSRFRSSSSYASTSPSTKQRNPAHRRSINVFSSTKLKHSASDSTDKNGVKNRLKKFMTRRPSMKTLQEKGLIKDQVFGSHLSTLCKREGTTVPQFIQTCLDAIEKRGLETDGIYRVSGNLATIQKLRFVVDHEEELDLDHHQWEDIHVVTGALKLFFRELSEPLFPFSFFQPFVEAIKIKDHQEKLDAVRKLVQQLPRPNYDIMKLLFSHLQRVLLHSKKNLMSTQGIAIVFGPTLMWPNLDAGNVAVNMVYQNHIVEFILIESQNIFVMDKK